MDTNGGSQVGGMVQFLLRDKPEEPEDEGRPDHYIFSIVGIMEASERGGLRRRGALGSQCDREGGE